MRLHPSHRPALEGRHAPTQILLRICGMSCPVALRAKSRCLLHEEGRGRRARSPRELRLLRPLGRWCRRLPLRGGCGRRGLSAVHRRRGPLPEALSGPGQTVVHALLESRLPALEAVRGLRAALQAAPVHLAGGGVTVMLLECSSPSLVKQRMPCANMRSCEKAENLFRLLLQGRMPNPKTKVPDVITVARIPSQAAAGPGEEGCLHCRPLRRRPSHILTPDLHCVP
mmetsp:Transcript_39672/g.84634  ORF Transcript_39672/g.84634 Transcript_39672/m.84634 type:complete len:227 (-) Transcript_39672:208-888(-)